MRYEGIQSNFAFKDFTPENLKKEAEALISDAKQVYDRVGAVDKGEVSLSTVIVPLLDIERDSYTRGVALQLPSMVALDKGLRDASSEAEKMLDEFSVEMSMRKDIFDNLVAFSQTDEAKGLNPELQR
jgi:Zn-dependent oligopeptidase